MTEESGQGQPREGQAEKRHDASKRHSQLDRRVQRSWKEGREQGVGREGAGATARVGLCASKEGQALGLSDLDIGLRPTAQGKVPEKPGGALNKPLPAVAHHWQLPLPEILFSQTSPQMSPSL